MKNFIGGFIVLFMVGVAGLTESAIIENDMIVAYGSDWYFTNWPSKTIDDDFSTQWIGKDNLQIGDVNILAYNFLEAHSITQIDFYEEIHNEYLLGELEIQISQNTTDGFDGNWTTIDQFSGDYDPPGGEFSSDINTDYTQWIRLVMTYQGRGAYGVTPAFSLTEIDFHGDPVPIPSAVWLLGSGLIALVGLRKRLKR